MKISRYTTLGVCALMLAGCALPMPVRIAFWAVDGVSYLATQKSLTDHGLSAVAARDCALLRGITERALCRPGDGGAVVADVAVTPAEMAEAVEVTETREPMGSTEPVEVAAVAAVTDGTDAAPTEAELTFVTAAGSPAAPAGNVDPSLAPAAFDAMDVPPASRPVRLWAKEDVYLRELPFGGSPVRRVLTRGQVAVLDGDGLFGWLPVRIRDGATTAEVRGWVDSRYLELGG